MDAVSAVGNAAGDGARIALLDYERRVAVQQAVMELHYVETAVEPKFQEHFVAAMALPHATAPYPHLKELLTRDGQQPPNCQARGRRRRRRRTG